MIDGTRSAVSESVEAGGTWLVSDRMASSDKRNPSRFPTPQRSRDSLGSVYSATIKAALPRVALHVLIYRDDRPRRRLRKDRYVWLQPVQAQRLKI